MMIYDRTTQVNSREFPYPYELRNSWGLEMGLSTNKEVISSSSQGHFLVRLAFFQKVSEVLMIGR